MRLKSIEYVENEGLPEEWHLEGCSFDDVNLIVGKNASGKTRTLDIVLALTHFLSGASRPPSHPAEWGAVFESDGTEAHYQVRCKDNKIVREKLVENGESLLQRGEDGTGRIFAERLDRHIKFQPPSDEFALVTRRDAIQHPFLEKYHVWGRSVRHFRFGTLMGQNRLAMSGSGMSEGEPDLRDTTQVVAIFRQGEARFGEKFVRRIVSDMRRIGYDLEHLSSQPIGQASIAEGLREVSGIRLKERELNAATSHHQISAGMFRALSLIIQVNHSLLASLPSCILIDDIGEGLDYSRSKDLIDLLIGRIRGTGTQLLMSSNDRFVMNSVPLRHWSVIRRLPDRSVVYNRRNSKVLFDEFEFSGLSNFDFFSSNYLFRDSSDTLTVSN